MDYEVSQKLVNILIRNGFVEKEGKVNPSHWISSQEGRRYDPDTMSRSFRLGGFLIVFAHRRITGIYQNRKLLDVAVITERQLRSALFYNSATGNDRLFMAKYRLNPFGLADFIERSVKYIDLDPAAYRMQLMQLKEHFDAFSMA
jgi:hypothetical protein